MGSVVVLEWTFTPANYFEEVIEISRDDYTMTIADGQVRAEIESAIFEADPGIRQRLHDALDDRFQGVQVVTFCSYELSSSTKTREHPDGRRDIFIDAEPGKIVITGGAVDIRVTDKDGNVITDSKQDRIAKKKDFAELVSAHRPNDTFLASMLKSYKAAIRDPSNELVHLYEIRDAISKRFGSKIAAKELGIEEEQWSRFGKLCSFEPLRQGRHRGANPEALRDATEDELTEARGIAQALIVAYLEYLERAD